VVDGQVVAAFKALVESMPTWQMEADNHEGWYATIDEGEGRQGFVIMRQVRLLSAPLHYDCSIIMVTIVLRW
jgi:hypothetical protein